MLNLEIEFWMLAPEVDICMYLCNIINKDTLIIYYRTVAFSKMMNDQGLVVGIEHITQLYEKGLENIKKSHMDLITSGAIVLVNGDGRMGYEKYQPYNCIHVGAASETIPQELIDQLALNGRLMIPVGKQGDTQNVFLIDKDLQGNVTQQSVLAVNYVPLTSVEKQLN
jgi:protein-L-isoaspartate(D-aspartate) O-methyltransferase